MSPGEFLNWCTYRNKYGPLHWGMRIDRAVAHQLRTWANSKTKGTKFRFPDFSPYDEANRTPVSVDLDNPEAVFGLLQGLAPKDRS